MRELVYAMFINNNHTSFLSWWMENLLKLGTVSRYYETGIGYLTIPGIAGIVK